MSINKNTFKYLSSIFGIIFLHLSLIILLWSLIPDGTVLLYSSITNAVFLTIIISGSVLLSSKYTGQGKLWQQKKKLTLIIICSFVLSIAILLIDFIALIAGIFNDAGTLIYLPVLQLLGIVITGLTVMAMCKLISAKDKLKFPKGRYLAVCLLPAVIYILIGLLLVAADSYKLLSFLDKFDYYAGSNLFIFYYFGLYMTVQEVTIGWSIFCMFKYNQSMRIKTLLEMQAKL